MPASGVPPDFLQLPLPFFAVYSVLEKILEAERLVETQPRRPRADIYHGVVATLGPELNRCIFNRKSGYKNKHSFDQAILPQILAYEQSLECLRSFLPVNCPKLSIQDSPVAWGRQLYTYASNREPVVRSSECPGKALRVVTTWQALLKARWESAPLAPELHEALREMIEAVDFLSKCRLGNNFAETAVAKIKVSLAAGYPFRRSQKRPVELGVFEGDGSLTLANDPGSDQDGDDIEDDDDGGAIEASDWEPLDLYRQESHQTLSPSLVRLCSALEGELGLSDHALTASFVRMLGLVASRQPADLLDTSVREELQSFFSGLPVAEEKALLHVEHKLDTAYRSRAKTCVHFYVHLFGHSSVTQPTVALWLLCICPFRYFGRPELLENALIALGEAKVREVFGGGLTPDTRESVVKTLRMGLLRDWAYRSSVKGYRDQNDGRCRVYSLKLPSFAPDDRRLDHMLVALDSWSYAAMTCAGAILRILGELGQTERVAANRLEEAVVNLMDGVLQMDLIGRPGASGSVQDRAACYASKFVLDTLYWFILCCACRRVSQPPYTAVSMEEPVARCACVACRDMLLVRQRWGFVGPALRLFYKKAGGPQPVDARSLPHCTAMLKLVNQHLQASFCVYALQFVPCIWGKFLRLARLLSSGGCKKQSNCGTFMALESKFLLHFFLLCKKHGLEGLLSRADPSAVRVAAVQFDWHAENGVSVLEALLQALPPSNTVFTPCAFTDSRRALAEARFLTT
ncbi:Uncharacterized protein SCF082_LOCUS290, partial [Durusdinium trenchii]